eukprot:CAMPEP_0118862940 /NCGR_PEP_ID=MMETSP1163-20130328/7990_1 /TAXON_ID=124430 /ORGANISM="Phaeomonas parva, Strain CCMP2877" /LENGTH=72 /DNA_ID=CAMNT_0006796901 /DNA_START=18 /DNA_END=236 /DNA_ORIENTATION=+
MNSIHNGGTADDMLRAIKEEDLTSGGRRRGKVGGGRRAQNRTGRASIMGGAMQGDARGTHSAKRRTRTQIQD